MFSSSPGAALPCRTSDTPLRGEPGRCCRAAGHGPELNSTLLERRNYCLIVRPFKSNLSLKSARGHFHLAGGVSGSRTCTCTCDRVRGLRVPQQRRVSLHNRNIYIIIQLHLERKSHSITSETPQTPVSPPPESWEDPLNNEECKTSPFR